MTEASVRRQLETKRESRRPRASAAEVATADLVSIAAEHALGTVVNQVDAVCASVGRENVPAVAITLALAIRGLLFELGVRDGMHPEAAQVYRERV